VEVRLLLVEDDRTLGDAVRAHLESDGHVVDWVTTAAQARAAAGDEFDAILLDWQLPDGSGVQWLRELRAKSGVNRSRPVLMLTARDLVADRVLGLDAGADDYLVKPFELAELSARLRALARRASGPTDTRLRAGRIEVDPAAKIVRLDDKPIDVTAKEFALLEALVRRAGRIVSRGDLEGLLYGFGAAVDSNAVEVHVSNLRRKLGRDAIETVRGLGYRIAP
jgi:two-component system OmpR family response regulator